jgi:hypothetical protein
MTVGLIYLSGQSAWLSSLVEYVTEPCGDHASSQTYVDADTVSLASSISIWETGIPLSITALCEFLVTNTA